MSALALRLRQTRVSWLPRSAASRVVCGGALSGLVLSAGLAALSYQTCGGMCLADALVTAAITAAAGIAAAMPATLARF